MKTKILLLFSLLVTSSLMAQQVDVANSSIEKVGRSIDIKFDVKVNKLRSNSKVILRPIVRGEFSELELTPIVVKGRRRAIIDERNGITDANMIVGTAGVNSTYAVSVPYRNYRTGVELIINGVAQNCSSKWVLDQQIVAVNNLIPIYPVVDPRYDNNAKECYYRDFITEVERCPCVYSSSNGWRKRGSDVKVFFETDDTAIDSDYMDNAASLESVRRAVALIDRHPDARICRVKVSGSASVEGPYALNEQLGEARADKIVDCISDYVDSSLCERVDIGENWSALREMVAESDMPNREKVLDIIESYTIEQGRIEKIRAIDNGSTYRYMLREFFPEQRCASYKEVVYEITPNEDLEAIELSLLLMDEGDYYSALVLLECVEPNAYTENLMGVCCMMLDEIEPAREHLLLSMAAGNVNAIDNMRLLDHKVKYCIYE